MAKGDSEKGGKGKGKRTTASTRVVNRRVTNPNSPDFTPF
jgi:hypothetical protein